MTRLTHQNVLLMCPVVHGRSGDPPGRPYEERSSFFVGARRRLARPAHIIAGAGQCGKGVGETAGGRALHKRHRPGPGPAEITHEEIGINNGVTS